MLTAVKKTTGEYIAPPELAALLGLTVAELRRHLRCGRLPAPSLQLGRKRVLWRRDVIEKWLTGEGQ